MPLSFSFRSVVVDLADVCQPEHLPSNRPIILDETYESPETAALHEEGYEGALVARSGSPSSLISMSAYGKQPLPQLHGQF
jgi:hypothetical protein